MNPKTTKNCFAVVVLPAAALLLVAPDRSIAAAVCDDNSGNSPYVCVAWSQAGNPDPLTDFTFDFQTDPANPGVALRSGDTGWVVWSQVSSSDTTAANLGAIEIDPSSASENFSVTVANGTLPGAKDVGSMDLNAVGWTGYSSVGGANITGNLAGDLVLKKDPNGAGGVLGGFVDVAGDSSGHIDVALITGKLAIAGNLSGDIDVRDRIDGGTLAIGKNVASSVRIVVAGMGPGSSFLNLGGGGAFIDTFDFAGSLVVAGDIPAKSFVTMVSTLTSTGSIDLTGQFCRGRLGCASSDAGSSVSLGTLVDNGQFVLNPLPGLTVSALITMDSIAATGSMRFEVGVLDGDITVLGDLNGVIGFGPGDFTDGTISIGGNLGGGISATVNADNQIMGLLAGDIVVSGDMASSSLIQADSDIAGAVSIGGNMAGDITAGNLSSGEIGDLTGTIDIGKDLSGDITVRGGISSTGSIAVGEETGKASRIVVEGKCDGAIDVAQGTGKLTLMHLQGGLGSTGSVAINTDAGDFDADGDIHVGEVMWTPSLDVVFDGCIHVESGPPGSGELNGDITVMGCHATADDLNICADGGINGAVVLGQNGCANQVTYSCTLPCP